MPALRNERTSKRVARIAGRILAMDVAPRLDILFVARDGMTCHWIEFQDLKTLAASALTQTVELTQAVDRKAKPRAKAARKPKAKTK